MSLRVYCISPTFITGVSYTLLCSFVPEHAEKAVSMSTAAKSTAINFFIDSNFPFKWLKYGTAFLHLQPCRPKFMSSDMFACHKFCKTVGNGISVFYAFNIVCVFLITDVAVNGIGVIVFVNAYKVHKVISELGLDDFNISCFARGVKACLLYTSPSPRDS